MCIGQMAKELHLSYKSISTKWDVAISYDKGRELF